ncbi:hypothetical protein FHS83_002534 [Rhizomicrobium palustre]|uniref:Uncharacterized protein n=1 Tax=Rhizomicrobium palustre TaxID=189966 RepID=A0A846N0K2_9PROT|nr:DUF6496 domain-containing protein [Rhizomicrobium palustre]NIK89216.1 hypothetical protein [Rhizomicrobium palustre]
MAKTTRRQRKTTGRVMHEFKHGELGRGRAGGKVKSRKQAIAIALSEAGASNRQSPTQKRKARKKTTKKQARGVTGQQRQEAGKTVKRTALSKKTTRKKTTRKSAQRKTATRKTPTRKIALRKKATKRTVSRKKTPR